MPPLNRRGTKKRSGMPKRQFAAPKGTGPDKSKNQYPIDSKGRARAAKGRATQAHKKGRISKSKRDAIHRKANARLRRKG